MQYELIEGEGLDVRPAITDPLRVYNREQNPIFFSVRDEPANAPRPFHIVVRDDAGAIVGGLLGETQFAWMKIEIVSVRSDVRRHGIGTELMNLAETEALRRGCKYLFLDTMSYQAPEFYRKLGFAIAGQIADWDSHGNTKFFMVKKL